MNNEFPSDQDIEGLDLELLRGVIEAELAKKGVTIADRDDLIQEVLLVVLEKQKSKDIPADPAEAKKWVRGVTGKKILEHCRTVKRWKTIDLSDDVLPDSLLLSVDLDQQIEDEQKAEQEAKHKALRGRLRRDAPGCSETDYDVIAERCVAKKSSKTIANEKGTTVGAIHNSIARVVAIAKKHQGRSDNQGRSTRHRAPKTDQSARPVEGGASTGKNTSRMKKRNDKGEEK